MLNSIETTQYSDRHLIESVLKSFFIVDYGYIVKVNGDGTVKVGHAVIPQTDAGEELQAMETDKVEWLSFSTAEISIDIKPKAGDKVLLVGLKDMVRNTADVTKPIKMQLPAHYDRLTLKALPFAPFDTNAKVTLELDGGKATLKIDQLTIDASKVTVKHGTQTMLEVGT